MIKKVAPEVQAKLNLYRAEGFRALDAWFRQGLRSDPVVTESPRYVIPQTLAEALEFAAKQVREKEALQAENKIMADPVLSKGVSIIDIPSAGGAQKTTMVEITTMLPDGSKINVGQVLTSTVIEMRTVARGGMTCVVEISTQLPSHPPPEGFGGKI